MISGTHNQASEEVPRRLVRGLFVCNDLFRSKNSRRKNTNTHTHTHRATRSRSSNRRGTWRRLVSLRSEDAKLECLAKAECKGRGYFANGVTRPRAVTTRTIGLNATETHPCFRHLKDLYLCTCRLKAVQSLRWLLLQTSRVKPLD
jgi:hypothetical protein